MKFFFQKNGRITNTSVNVTDITPPQSRSLIDMHKMIKFSLLNMEKPFSTIRIDIGVPVLSCFYKTSVRGFNNLGMPKFDNFDIFATGHIYSQTIKFLEKQM